MTLAAVRHRWILGGWHRLCVPDLYAVFVLIEIESVGYPSLYADAVASVEYEGWPDLNEVAAIRDKIIELYPNKDRYVVEIRLSEFEWGASAGDIAVIVSLAASLRQLWPDLRKILDWATRHNHESEYLDDQEAERLARWRIAIKFDVQGRELRKIKISESLDQRGWEIHFRDNRGVSFAVTVQTTSSGVPLTFISVDWTAIGGAPERPPSQTT